MYPSGFIVKFTSQILDFTKQCVLISRLSLFKVHKYATQFYLLGTVQYLKHTTCVARQILISYEVGMVA